MEVDGIIRFGCRGSSKRRLGSRLRRTNMLHPAVKFAECSVVLARRSPLNPCQLGSELIRYVS